jgi:hypothetical protein
MLLLKVKQKCQHLFLRYHEQIRVALSYQNVSYGNIVVEDLDI